MKNNLYTIVKSDLILV